MTRRQALQLGAATGAAAMLGGPTALARAATGSTPKHLLRSSYLPLAGQQFRVGGRLLQLGVVDDLAGADGDSALRGHPEAFALTFYGPPNALGATVQTFSHPAVGTYSLLITPVGAVEGQVQRYEVVVDRSVGAPRHAARARRGHVAARAARQRGGGRRGARAVPPGGRRRVAPDAHADQPPPADEAPQAPAPAQGSREVGRGKRRAAMKRAAERGEQLAVRGAASVIG